MSILFAPLPGFPFLYLDPGSGSFIIQMLIAAALGVGVAVKVYWAKLKALVTGKKPEQTQTLDEDDDDI